LALLGSSRTGPELASFGAEVTGEGVGVRERGGLAGGDQSTAHEQIDEVGQRQRLGQEIERSAAATLR